MAEKRPDEPGCVVIAVVVFLGVSLAALAGLVGFGIGKGQGTGETRQQAIEAGVGQFVADPATGKVTFEFSKGK